jgi:hypothetical protein
MLWEKKLFLTYESEAPPQTKIPQTLEQEDKNETPNVELCSPQQSWFSCNTLS